MGYTYEEAGIRVCSMLDEELPIIEIPTPVRILFCFERKLLLLGL